MVPKNQSMPPLQQIQRLGMAGNGAENEPLVRYYVFGEPVFHGSIFLDS
jgi:hypothetical protein